MNEEAVEHAVFINEAQWAGVRNEVFVLAEFANVVADFCLSVWHKQLGYCPSHLWFAESMLSFSNTFPSHYIVCFA